MKRFTSDSVTVSIRPPRTPRWNRLIPNGAHGGVCSARVGVRSCRTLAEPRRARWPSVAPTSAHLLGVLSTTQFLVQTFRSVPELPIRQLWQSGLDSLDLGSANDWLLPVPSHSHSSPGTTRDQVGALGARCRSRAFGGSPRSDQIGDSSRRSKARDSARRSVTGLCSESARVRITARSLRVEDEPARASARSRSSRTTVSSRASFRPFRSNSIITPGTPTRLYSSERRVALSGSYREPLRVDGRTGAHNSYMRPSLGISA